MVSLIVRTAGVLLLIAAVLSAPVLGMVPRCGKTGALAGQGHCCCCAAQVLNEEALNCCPDETRPCCAEPGVAAESPLVPPCSCSFTRPPLATVEPDRHDYRAAERPAHEIGCPGAPRTCAVGEHFCNFDPEPLKVPLRKIYCRWIV